MRNLRKIKEQDEIRNILSLDLINVNSSTKVDKIDLELLVSECNYSDDFIARSSNIRCYK